MTINPIQVAQAAKAAKAKTRADSVVQLSGGAKRYLDCAPGIGVVLEFGNRKCYFQTNEQADEAWEKRYKKTFGTK